MRKRILILVFVLFLLLISSAMVYLSRDYKLQNKVNDGEILFYYLHEELVRDNIEQTLMAFTTEGAYLPVFKIKNGSYSTDLVKENDKIFIYNELTFSYKMGSEAILPRQLITYSLKDHTIKIEEGSHEEGNYYFSKKSKSIKKVTPLEKIKARKIIEYNNTIFVLIGKNKILKIINNNIDEEESIEEYNYIFNLVQNQEHLLLMGENNKGELLLTILDKNLNRVISKVFKNIKDLGETIPIEKGWIGVGYKQKTDSENSTLLSIDLDLNYTVLEGSFKGDNIFYSSKSSKLYYYHNEKKSYLYLDSKNNEWIEIKGYFTDEEYNFSNGKLYIN